MLSAGWCFPVPMSLPLNGVSLHQWSWPKSIIDECRSWTFWFSLSFCSDVLLWEQASLTLWNECISHVQIFVTAWTVDRQAPLYMEFSRQKYWSGWPCPLPGKSSQPRDWTASLKSPALAGYFFTSSVTWETPRMNKYIYKVSNGGKCASLSVSFFFLSFSFLPSFPFFSFLVFLFSFSDNQNGPHILFFVLYYSHYAFDVSIAQEIFEHIHLSGTRCPGPPHADPAPDLGPTCLPKSFQSSVWEQDLELRIWLPVYSLYCQKVLHFIVQKSDLTPVVVHSTVPTGSCGRVGTELPDTQLRLFEMGSGFQVGQV